MTLSNTAQIKLQRTDDMEMFITSVRPEFRDMANALIVYLRTSMPTKQAKRMLISENRFYSGYFFAAATIMDVHGHEKTVDWFVSLIRIASDTPDETVERFLCFINELEECSLYDEYVNCAFKAMRGWPI